MTICFHCTKLGFVMKQHSLSVADIESPEVLIVGYKRQKELACGECGRVLFPEEMYFEDERDYESFVRKTLDAIAEKISAQLDYCSRCDGYDIERSIYLVNKGEARDLIKEGAYGQTVWEFMSDNDIPERYFNEIRKRLCCRNCGRRDLEIGQRVYSEDDMDSFWGRKLISFAFSYGINIGSADLEEFRTHLYYRPMLAMQHEVGGKYSQPFNGNSKRAPTIR
ncbi:hypothetical protein [Cohnella faecalis]|uniref:Uncharacterized protein n=1 Tax=Cohnella faecalis TaxID=2315694 RepID=A0A398CV08_9BACL|nr:hypothetical protein [Cohnella faecalis]RIE05109.1 hypothetical protein D3H35_02990 [Cohnella faecalis]